MRNTANQGWSFSDQLLGILIGILWLALLPAVKFPAATGIPVFYAGIMFAVALMGSKKIDISVFWNTPITLALTLANTIIVILGIGVAIIVTLAG